ncbi:MULTISPECIES: serine hydrolase [unclassified Shewanella]|uniref:serine hydrolase domain-containing protein n=1 Tax=unclassified Shewanella TaxID=196818 RepID=UPI001BC2B734|nr:MULTISPECIES: serine hydrolase domain-containing protein [unclassified Shewanella]GIU04808.1 serine hydrolase [Shewanella sp. MBTL60-112-B1]GIU24758.1 serine hydrolase [Shewanella sp. MBTL60-112-B2]
MHLITKTLIGSVVVGCCLWAANKASANRVASSDIAKQLPNIINQAQRPFSGVVMVKQNNQPVFAYISGDNIDNHSSFLIGSLSKQVTAALVLKAVDDGLIDLHKSVSHYLLKDGNKPRAYVPPSVTVSQLLSHTSGLLTLGEPPVFKPGSQFQYSNYGYALLGDILEVVYQKPIDQLVAQLNQQNKLDGLYAQTGDINSIEATHANFILGNTETLTQSADGSSQSQLIPVELSIDKSMIAFGGMVASVEAYGRFQDALYNGKLLSPKSLALMTSPQATRNHRWGALEYGYGTQISRDEQLVEYSHSGYLPGYVSLAVYYPKSKVSLVILENTSWDLSNRERVFGLHDAIRSSIRNRLAALEDRPVAKLYQASVSAFEDTFAPANTAAKAVE